MLINLNKKNKFQSEYECDMCKTKIEARKRYTVYIGLGSGTPKKEWDLCEKCFKIVKKNVENWYNKILQKSIDKNVK